MEEPAPSDRAPDDSQERSGPYVRLKGYVHPEPIVRRIGDRDVFVGNRRAADPGDHAERFGPVLSLTSEPRQLTTHHHPLTDGTDADWDRFAGAVDAARELFGDPEPLLIHCKAGVSRSPAVAATAIAAEEDRPLRAALAAVQSVQPHAMPHPALHELATVYLAARDGCL